MRQGTVIFFRGRGWKSRAIQAGTMDLWTTALAVAVAAVCWWIDGVAFGSIGLAAGLAGAWFYSPRFSHCAIIGTGGLLYESTTLARTPCLRFGKVTQGVQVHDAEYRVATYDGAVLLAVPRDRLGPTQKHQLGAILNTYVGSEYGMVGALVSGTKCVKWAVRAVNKSLLGFCSEYVALALKEIGLFPIGLRARLVHPNLLYDTLVNTDQFDFQWVKPGSSSSLPLASSPTRRGPAFRSPAGPPSGRLD